MASCPGVFCAEEHPTMMRPTRTNRERFSTRFPLRIGTVWNEPSLGQASYGCASGRMRGAASEPSVKMAGGSLLQLLVAVVLEPIRPDDVLGVRQRHPIGTDFTLEMCLHPVLGLGADDLGWERAVVCEWMRRTTPHLCPEVLRVIRIAADFESDEVVFLVV